MKVKRDLGTEACMAVEAVCADVYRRLSERFPEAGSLWRTLSAEEEDHALRLESGKAGRENGFLLDFSFFDRKSMPFINGAIGCARALKNLLEAGGLTLEDALRMSLELEKNTVEGYFWDVLTGETDSETADWLKQLIGREKSHGERLAAFMSGLGIPHKNFRPEIPVD